MCTPSADELVTLREFLACKDPQDATKTHTFSYLIDEEDRRVAEEILETSVASPWEMIRSLTQEDSAGDDPGRQWASQELPQISAWPRAQQPAPPKTDLAPSAVFVPKLLNGGADVRSVTRPGAAWLKPSHPLPEESTSRAAGTASTNFESLRHLTAMAKSQIEASSTRSNRVPPHAHSTARQHIAPQQHLIVEKRAPRSRNREGPSVASSADRSAIRFPILGEADEPFPGGPAERSAYGTTGSVASSSHVGIKLLKVFENDEFITFRKVYPASMGGTALSSVGARRSTGSSLPSSGGTAESRGQSDTRRPASHHREARRDPPETREMEGHANVISEETKVSSTGARQVLIVVSSKNKSKDSERHR